MSAPPDGAGELRRWDRWWQQHGRQSREQWAREAIAKRPALSINAAEVTGASRAAECLLVLNRQRYEWTLITHPASQITGKDRRHTGGERPAVHSRPAVARVREPLPVRVLQRG